MTYYATDPVSAYRPSPSWDPPEGYKLVPCEEGADWRRILPPGLKRCRFTVGPRQTSCKAPAVAELERGRSRPSWWAYCSEHMYGRWIEDGKIMFWRAVPVDSTD